jgi:phosphatidylserine/phosphatidylglycerophosphate/cardiolipin synthase-like enzyme
MPAIAAVHVRTLFAPFDDTTGEFLRFVQSATRSIDILIFGFHLPKLTDILIAKHQARVRVSLLLDHSQEAGKAERGEVEKLLAAGVPLLIGTSPVHGQILHSKFTVVDGKAVEHGSWNYSLSASQQSNDMHFVEHEGYAQAYLQHHNAIRSFILLHEMAYQPKGEVAPRAAKAKKGPAPVDKPT